MIGDSGARELAPAIMQLTNLISLDLCTYAVAWCMAGVAWFVLGRITWPCVRVCACAVQQLMKHAVWSRIYDAHMTDIHG